LKREKTPRYKLIKKTPRGRRIVIQKGLTMDEANKAKGDFVLNSKSVLLIEPQTLRSYHESKNT
jgi:hypothetical protein